MGYRGALLLCLTMFLLVTAVASTDPQRRALKSYRLSAYAKGRKLLDTPYPGDYPWPPNYPSVGGSPDQKGRTRKLLDKSGDTPWPCNYPYFCRSPSKG
ncbi:hypothetical protein K2173_008577 [Erythroxylum novogranatense]|uniref:Uncharacterized protein n=1 Tax=Erythroxylum novogranatense TaxID=1862640 RepID=A0AAV8SKP2_9ROSI|nr:hypothetical protein K2173_008577 [Erythroxylum novogranatense]